MSSGWALRSVLLWRCSHTLFIRRRRFSLNLCIVLHLMLGFNKTEWRTSGTNYLISRRRTTSFSSLHLAMLLLRLTSSVHGLVTWSCQVKLSEYYLHED